MARHIKTESWFVADFETTGEEYANANGYTKVWLWAVCDSNANIVCNGTDLDSFMEWLLKESRIVYFHNLKFDGSFIVPWLEEKGFAYTPDMKYDSNRNFETLINNMGAWYSIKIKYGYNDGKFHRSTIEIRDSLKICPMKVEEMPKAFGLDTMKEKIDYSDYSVNETTISYVNHDVMVVAKALKFFYDMGFTRLTIGSDAFHDLKDYINNAFNEKHHNTGKNIVNAFGKVFPELDRTWLKTWRKAYTGGRCQVNPKYANKVVHSIKRFDINSMYPSIMAQKYMPYGEPVKVDKMGTAKFELYHITCRFWLKKGHLPTLLASKAKTIYGGDSKYYINQETPIDLYVSNIDFELMKRHYDILDLQVHEIYAFNTAKGIFTNWIMKYYNLKTQAGLDGNKGLKQVYKLIINNIYGKFGSSAQGKQKIPFMDGDTLRFNVGEEEDMAIYYLPVAIAITSYGHLMIDNEISDESNDWKVRDGFIYCDTDSVHTLGNIHPDMIDNTELGKFKLECVEETGKYIRAKTYCHKDDGEWSVTCAGMTPDIKRYLIDTYGDKITKVFKEGLTITPADLPKGYKPKLMHKQIKGGTILVPVPFSLNEVHL